MKTKTRGFGASVNFGASVGALRYVDSVVELVYVSGIDEDFKETSLVLINKDKFNLFKSDIAHHFNQRLKVSLKVGKWEKVETLLDVFLTKELAVLLWAIDLCEDEEEMNLVFNGWLAMRPEERWWMYQKVMSMSKVEAQNKRKEAVYLMLS